MPAPPPQNAHAQLRVKKNNFYACGMRILYNNVAPPPRRLFFCVNDLQNTKKNRKMLWCENFARIISYHFLCVVRQNYTKRNLEREHKYLHLICKKKNKLIYTE